ncbi:MAG TPA: hypothetical protein VF627_15925 [Abditibacterium sp.]|jgi:hypothetical protein
MNLVLELKPETLRRIEEAAAKQGTTPQQMLVELAEAKFDGGRRERLMKMAGELFDERASAYEALAEGAK